MTLRIGIDTGGTFTDLVGYDDETRTFVHAKQPSTPYQPSSALAAVLNDVEAGANPVHSLVLGTTVATNAILTRRGARVCFVTTAGFEDVPFIGRLDKEELYNLQWKKPDPLVARRDCFGVRERVAHTGQTLTPLDDATLANGCLRYLPGSHRLGMIQARHLLQLLADDIVAQEVAVDEARPQRRSLQRNDVNDDVDVRRDETLAMPVDRIGSREHGAARKDFKDPRILREEHAVADGDGALLLNGELRRDDGVDLRSVAEDAASSAGNRHHDRRMIVVRVRCPRKRHLHLGAVRGRDAPLRAPMAVEQRLPVVLGDAVVPRHAFPFLGRFPDLPRELA